MKKYTKTSFYKHELKKTWVNEKEPPYFKIFLLCGIPLFFVFLLLQKIKEGDQMSILIISLIIILCLIIVFSSPLFFSI